MAEKWLKYVNRKEYFPKFLTCFSGQVVPKSHLPTLILTCLWMSANDSAALSYDVGIIYGKLKGFKQHTISS